MARQSVETRNMGSLLRFFNLSLLARIDSDRFDERCNSVEILHPRTAFQPAGGIEAERCDLADQCCDPLGADASGQPPGKIAADPGFQLFKPGWIEAVSRSSKLIRTPGIQEQGIHACGISADAVEILFPTHP